MPALNAVPGGSDILIDANIFVFGFTNKSQQCKAFLGRCAREQVFGFTLFEVIHEATHVFMLGEAFEKKLAEEKRTRKYLTDHPEDVKTLKDYWVNAQNVLRLNLATLPMERRIIDGAQQVRATAGLLTNDSIIAAAMLEYGVSQIATYDRMFNAVAGISVFSPTDVV